MESNKKWILLLLVLAVFWTVTSRGQTTENVRYIEVKGSAEMEVQPNEMLLLIGIEEYWEEEFEKNKEPEDYKTKVPLAKIEDALIKSLRQAGIEKEDIRVRGLGNFWRQRGKEFLFSKQMEVKITDFSKVNELTALLDGRGIQYINVGQMNHSHIESFRKKMKTDALKDARDKAAYLVESLDEELGEVISITEMTDGFVRPYMGSNRMMAAEAPLESVDQVKNITVSSRMVVRFRIK